MPTRDEGTVVWVNHVKHELAAANVQFGTWVHKLTSPQIPRILAAGGFDFVNIDMEHSSMSIREVETLCASALDAGIVPIVRPPGHEPHLMSRPLDNGALGMYVPHVETRAQAEAAVRAIRFPPLGTRGSQPPSVLTNFERVAASDLIAHYDREVMLVVQIESARALEDLDGILGVDGVDGASIGRGDLSADLGLPGQSTHPTVVGAVESVIDACRRHGKFTALLVNGPDEARHWHERGVRMFTFAGEVHLLRDAASRAVQELRGAVTE